MGEGKVYLIGAGPGDPDLITVKGLNILRNADVVIYDRLVTKALMKLVPNEAEKIYVGKRAGWHTIPQDEICEIMIEKARSGKNVARLKGGDPFLFGRGGEEAQELRKAGVKFEVVPGVTSALAAPAYAGIPITHRKHASSVAIVTGHENQSKKQSLVDWEKLATAVDTIVVLMGVKRLNKIVEKLIKGGRNRQTSVAVIEWATTARQRTVIGTLDNIISKVASHKVSPPAIVVIGDVVKLHRALHWFEEEGPCL